MLLAFVAIVVGLVLLVYGADRFVTGAAQTASSLGVPPLIIGMTIVGIATSAPEVLVGSVAALQQKTNIALGNALGSNIANIGLVLGTTVLVSPLVTTSKTLRREYLIMFLASVLALLLCLDQSLSRIDGAILIISLLVIVTLIVRLAMTSPDTDPLASEFKQEYGELVPLKKSVVIIVIGLLLLLGGAELLVRGAVYIASTFGVSDLVIGLTIIAVGTSLPELAASIMSVIKKEADIAIGNVIGSNMFNMLMVLGVPSMIYPGEFGNEVLVRDFPVMIGFTLVMGAMVFYIGHGKFSRPEGFVLLSGFIAYQYWLFSTIS